MPKGTQEGVIILQDEQGHAAYIIRKNGTVRWYKLQELTYGDFVELLGADKATE